MVKVRRDPDVVLGEKLGVSAAAIRLTRSLPNGREALRTALIMKRQSQAKTGKSYKRIGKHLR